MYVPGWAIIVAIGVVLYLLSVAKEEGRAEGRAEDREEDREERADEDDRYDTEDPR